MTYTSNFSTNSPTIQLGAHYEVSWDGALPHDGRFLRGVIVREDGPVAAWLRRDGLGEFLETAYSADDEVIAPMLGWERAITRQLN